MDYIKIGKRIREQRIARNITQETLAEYADISVTHMSHIETGSTKLSLSVLVKIANALDVSTDDLLCDSVKKTKRFYMGNIEALLADCTDSQLEVICKVIQGLKENI